MSAATSPGTGLAYGLRRVCAAWGMARSSFYAMTSGQHAEQPRSRRGPIARDLGPALLVAIEAAEARPGRAGLPQGLGSAIGSDRDIRVLASRCVGHLDGLEQSVSPHRPAAKSGNP